MVLIVKKYGSQKTAHFPFNVVGQCAEKDMGSDAFRQTMEDGTHFYVNRLEAAKSPFHDREFLIGGHGVLRAEALGRYAGAHHVEAIERRLGLDLFLFAFIFKIGLCDGQREMLCHFVPVDDFAYAKGNVLLATQRSALSPCGFGDGLKQLLLGGVQQFCTRATPVFRQKRIATNHQPFAGIVGGGNFSHVPVIKE